jgi:hypothetical protein
LEKILLAAEAFDLKKEGKREMENMNPKHFFFQSAFILEMNMKDVSYKFGTEQKTHSKFHRLI